MEDYLIWNDKRMTAASLHLCAAWAYIQTPVFDSITVYEFESKVKSSLE